LIPRSSAFKNFGLPDSSGHPRFQAYRAESKKVVIEESLWLTLNKSKVIVENNPIGSRKIGTGYVLRLSLPRQREVEHRICVVRGALKLPLNACVKLCEPSLLIKQVAKRLV
jgi:hypothetical protein